MFFQMFFQMLKSAHFYKTWAHGFVATLLALFIHAGMVAAPGILPLFATAFGISLVMLLGGLGSTIFARGLFNLAQVGIAIQLAMFWVSGIIATWLVALVVPVTVTSLMCASASMMLAYILLSALTGHIQQYMKRSWLPVRMPK